MSSSEEESVSNSKRRHEMGTETVIYLEHPRLPQIRHGFVSALVLRRLP